MPAAAATVRPAAVAAALACALAAAASLAGCGEGVTPGAGGDSSAGAAAAGRSAAANLTATPAPVVHRLGPDDGGRTVTTAVGDKIVVTLSTNRLAARWVVAGYPRDALAREPASPPGAFGFVARAPGSGRVVLTRPGCGAPQCPGGGAVPLDPTTPAPVSTWAVTVVVR